MKKRSLGREIGLVLALKVAAIAALYFAFFAGDRRPHVTPQSVAALIYSPKPATR